MSNIENKQDAIKWDEAQRLSNDGYKQGCVDGYKQAIEKACNWLDENLEYYLGDYNLASHDFEENQPLYGRLIDELRKHMKL